jgi:hypothetical protein
MSPTHFSSSFGVDGICLSRPSVTNASNTSDCTSDLSPEIHNQSLLQNANNSEKILSTVMRSPTKVPWIDTPHISIKLCTMLPLEILLYTLLSSSMNSVSRYVGSNNHTTSSVSDIGLRPDNRGQRGTTSSWMDTESAGVIPLIF